MSNNEVRLPRRCAPRNDGGREGRGTGIEQNTGKMAVPHRKALLGVRFRMLHSDGAGAESHYHNAVAGICQAVEEDRRQK